MKIIRYETKEERSELIHQSGFQLVEDMTCDEGNFLCFVETEKTIITMPASLMPKNVIIGALDQMIDEMKQTIENLIAESLGV